jgi:hypothetical protein
MLSKLLSRQERRRRIRQLLNTSVRLITEAGALEALGINISEGGMGLFTVANLPIGSRIEVEFRSADGPTSFMRVRGTVRHRALYLYGVEFLRDESPDPLNAGEQESAHRQTQNQA